MSLSYGNQSIDLQSKSMDWFLYDRDVRHERVKSKHLTVFWGFQGVEKGCIGNERVKQLCLQVMQMNNVLNWIENMQQILLKFNFQM